MSPDTTEETVKRYPRAVAAGEFDVLAELCTDDVVNHTPLDDVRGIGALTEYETRIHRALPDFDVAFEDLLIDGDRVAMRLTISGVHQGPLLDVEPTGNEVAFGNTVFHRMDDGLIAERWVLPDVFGLLVQLGAIEPPE